MGAAHAEAAGKLAQAENLIEDLQAAKQALEEEAAQKQAELAAKVGHAFHDLLALQQPFLP